MGVFVVECDQSAANNDGFEFAGLALELRVERKSLKRKIKKVKDLLDIRENYMIK
jgi:hypothetical protein